MRVAVTSVLPKMELLTNTSIVAGSGSPTSEVETPRISAVVGEPTGMFQWVGVWLAPATNREPVPWSAYAPVVVNAITSTTRLDIFHDRAVSMAVFFMIALLGRTNALQSPPGNRHPPSPVATAYTRAGRRVEVTLASARDAGFRASGASGLRHRPAGPRGRRGRSRGAG